LPQHLHETFKRAMTAIQILPLSALVLAFLLLRAPSGKMRTVPTSAILRPKRRHVSEFEPVERWIAFPTLAGGLAILGALAIAALLLWR
jgi:hypothetical protein